MAVGQASQCTKGRALASPHLQCLVGTACDLGELKLLCFCLYDAACIELRVQTPCAKIIQLMHTRFAFHFRCLWMEAIFGERRFGSLEEGR
jgi:hypothetical protein